MSGVTFSALGQERTLRLGIGAMRRYAEVVGRPMVADLERLQDFTSDVEAPAILCDVFWVATSPAVARDEAADLIDEIGLTEALRLFGAAAKAAFPQADAGN